MGPWLSLNDTEVTKTPEGRMHWFRRTVVDGFTETAHNLIGGKADTWTGKGMNFVKGATNVLRAADLRI